MVLSGCSSAISFKSSLRRATSQKTSTLGYWAMMALMYSFPRPLEAPVITAVTMEMSPFQNKIQCCLLLYLFFPARQCGAGDKVYNFFRFAAVNPDSIML